jgi:hypothetical protein
MAALFLFLVIEGAEVDRPFYLTVFCVNILSKAEVSAGPTGHSQ